MIDLARTSSCEEDFDLALYEHRGVDLVAWDERRGECAGRRVTIRYLTRQISERELLERVKELASVRSGRTDR